MRIPRIKLNTKVTTKLITSLMIICLLPLTEATVACFLRKTIFQHIAKNGGFLISQIISSKQSESYFAQKLKAY